MQITNVLAKVTQSFLERQILPEAEQFAKLQFLNEEIDQICVPGYKIQ